MIRFYNRLARKKEVFVPNNKDLVTMYSCGPTVYSYQHIGNMRAYVFMDEIARVLKYNGHNVEGAMNITDVGHLTSDEDEGEDKMLLASQREKKTPWEIADYYSNIFFEDLKKLNINTPKHVVKATDHIKDMISYVEELVSQGYAYETSKGIYFNVQKFKDYGKLSGMSLEDRKAGARIAVDEEKKHPADFALWIKAPKEHIMQWQSPWGMGYPGWHIECSVMGQKYLGKHIDIHTGGIDHVTVHHENEIAQNNCISNHEVVNFWMELEFLQIDGGKMSKSLGNVYTLADLEKRGYSAMDFKYFLHMAHYSKMQNFTFEALTGAKNAYSNLVKQAKKHKNADLLEVSLKDYEQRFLNAINDDLNIPLALGVVWEMLKLSPNKKVYELLVQFDKVLGLQIEAETSADHVFETIPDDVANLAQKRWEAKKNRQYDVADDLRNQIAAKGFRVVDEKTTYKVEKE